MSVCDFLFCVCVYVCGFFSVWLFECVGFAMCGCVYFVCSVI